MFCIIGKLKYLGISKDKKRLTAVSLHTRETGISKDKKGKRKHSSGKFLFRDILAKMENIGVLSVIVLSKRASDQ